MCNPCKVFLGATLALVCIGDAFADTSSLQRGRDLALRLCADCHLNKGQTEKSGPNGIPGFRAVANRPDQTQEDVVRWLKSVPPMMPNHRLTQHEIETLAEFIMSLRREE